jgi:hypothetical protein
LTRWFSPREARKIETYAAIGTSDSIIPDRALFALREITFTVDNLWRAALTNDSQANAVSLGEASQALHCALVLLTPS